MRKVMSKLINKEYWIDSERTACYQGLPCFTENELKELKKLGDISKEDFLKIYNMRIEFFPETAYPGTDKEAHQKPATLSDYYASKRSTIAHKYGAKIRSIITSIIIKNIKTQPEDVKTYERGCIDETYDWDRVLKLASHALQQIKVSSREKKHLQK